MEKIDKYDISKLDLFEFTETKRQELCNFHSLLLFLYNKKMDDKPDVFFKYSEIGWMDKRVVRHNIESLAKFELITIVSLPTPVDPFKIRLKTNDELNAILNKDKKLCFEMYNRHNLTRKEFAEALGCSRIREHFLLAPTKSWINNVNNGVWDLSEFLILSKVISYFSCENKIKTFTLQKYMAQKGHFILNKVRFLYSKIPLNKKDIISTQFNNTLRDLKISHDGSFEDMVRKYQKFILEKKKSPDLLVEKLETPYQNVTSLLEF